MSSFKGLLGGPMRDLEAPAESKKRERRTHFSNSPTACIYCNMPTRKGSITISTYDVETGKDFEQHAHAKCQREQSR